VIKLDYINKKYKTGGFFSKNIFNALNDISITIDSGEHIGIIGESGAGKTTLGRILSLIELPSGGSFLFNKTQLNKNNIKQFRKKVAAVFQDPYTSFDPRMKISSSLKETERSIKDIKATCKMLTIKEELLDKFPNQLSGGEQQRIAIARALLSNPDYIIFDEATSALDVSTQAKIINMLCSINEKKDYTYIFITHDLKLAHFISDRIYVLYRGYIVEEIGSIDFKPLHPYTTMLMSGKGYKNQSNTNSNYGCFFYEICPKRKDICKTKIPKLKTISKTSKVRCFLYD
jgi:peptide/nickel transport system ATP-binding protein